MPAVLGVLLSVVWAFEEAFNSYSSGHLYSALAFIYAWGIPVTPLHSGSFLALPTGIIGVVPLSVWNVCLLSLLWRSPRAVCLTVAAATVAHFCRFSSTTDLSCVLRLHRILRTRQYLVIAQAHLILNTGPYSSSSFTKVKVHDRWASEEGDKTSRATFPLLTGWLSPLQTTVWSDLTQNSVSSFRGRYVVFLCIKIFLHSRNIIFLFVAIRMKIFLQKSIFSF